jgi:hypothetical protein
VVQGAVGRELPQKLSPLAIETLEHQNRIFRREIDLAAIANSLP